MNWKEQFDKEFPNIYEEVLGVSGDGSDVVNCDDRVKSFISTEIVEKLINEIPDNMERNFGNSHTEHPAFGKCIHDTVQVKQQLKSKWL